MPREQPPPEMAASISNPSVVVNEQMVEMMITGHVPKEILHPGQRTPTPLDRPAEDTELAKWKAVEVFKVERSQTSCCISVGVLQITVNYLQVTAVAVAINAKWSLALIALFETAGKTRTAWRRHGQYLCVVC